MNVGYMLIPVVLFVSGILVSGSLFSISIPLIEDADKLAGK
jgi:hypothetical protein